MPEDSRPAGRNISSMFANMPAKRRKEDFYDQSSGHGFKLSLHDKKSEPTGMEVTSESLSHTAAKHKMSVKPKRTHGVPRKRRSNQLGEVRLLVRGWSPSTSPSYVSRSQMFYPPSPTPPNSHPVAHRAAETLDDEDTLEGKSPLRKIIPLEVNVSIPKRTFIKKSQLKVFVRSSLKLKDKFDNGIQKLVLRYDKCLNINENYVKE